MTFVVWASNINLHVTHFSLLIQSINSLNQFKLLIVWINREKWVTRRFILLAHTANVIVLRKSRFQIHITKGAKNYPKDYKVICKYDRTHLLDPQEYEHHLLVSPTSGDVKSKEIMLESNEDVQTVPVERVSSTKTNTKAEDWTGNNKSYDLLYEAIPFPS